MFPTVAEPTGEVVTTKFAAEAPAGTVTELGTVAAGLALVRLTGAHPTGAPPESVTVPVAD
jgi:hypothetical protein